MPVFEDITLPFGHTQITFRLEVDRIDQWITAPSIPSISDYKEAFSRALRNPIRSAPLSAKIKPGEKVAILASDLTRLWVRNDIFLPLLLEELFRIGVRDEDITVVVTCGTHRRHTPEEHLKMFGQEFLSRVKVIDHDCRDGENLVYLGTTSRGTPVRINRIVAESERKILTGGIGFHDLAGFSGGRKSIVPGVSSFETIQANHHLVMNPTVGTGCNPAVRSGQIEGNPLAEDMDEIAAMVAPDFLINVVPDDKFGFANIVAGDVFAAHREGCRLAQQYFLVRIKRRADLVVASCGGYPKDINLYSTYRSISHAMMALKHGGVLIMLSESSEGLGNKACYDIAANYGTMAERENALRANFTIAAHTGYELARCAEEAHIILVSGLEDQTVRDMGMTPAHSAEEALDLALRWLPADYTINLIANAHAIIPILTA